MRDFSADPVQAAKQIKKIREAAQGADAPETIVNLIGALACEIHSHSGGSSKKYVMGIAMAAEAMVRCPAAALETLSQVKSYEN